MMKSLPLPLWERAGVRGRPNDSAAPHPQPLSPLGRGEKNDKTGGRMKITELQIERYGVWRDLTLPLAESGLNVFYGPNEAGKTTLLRFLRGVLFGFTPRDFDGVTHEPDAMAGGLQVLDAGEPIHLHRGGGEARGKLSCSGSRGVLPAGETLSRLLGDIDDAVFEKVFAVGLREMQELGTLTDDSVAEHVYGLTLGPTGQRLLAACDRVRDERRKLIDPDQHTGQLAELFAKLDGIDSQLKSLHTLKRKHGELAGLRDELDDQIAGIKQRQAGIAEQLRGHTFLERAWGPWHRIRECDAELDELPVVNNFPEHGLEKLKQIESDIAAAAESRDDLIAQVRELRSQIKRLPLDRRLHRHGPALQSLIDQRGWLTEQQQCVANLGRTVAEAEQTLTGALQRLGPNWTASRLDSVDATPAASYRLANLARSLQAADSRRQRLERLDERLATAIRQRQERLRELVQALLAHSQASGGCDAPDDSEQTRLTKPGASQPPLAALDEALAAARQQLENLKQLAQLRLHEAELVERQAGIEEHRERIAPQTLLPDWVTSLLWVFSLAGGVLTVWGLYIGQHTSTLAGAIYALLGITCGGVAWGLRTQFEGAALERLSSLNDESAANLADLRATREAIRRLGGQPCVENSSRSPGPCGPANPQSKPTNTRSAGPQGPELQHSHAPSLEIKSASSADDWRPSRGIHDEHAWRPSVFWRWDARLRKVGGWIKSAVVAIDRWLDVLFDFLMDETAGATSSPRPLGEGSGVRANAPSTLPHPSPLPKGEGANAHGLPSPFGREVAGEGTPHDTDALDELAQIREITQRICELERWAFARRQLKRMGQRLAEVKRQLATAHREVGTARQAWCDLLGQLGLPADTKIETALDTWRQLVDAVERRRQLHVARAEFDHHRQLLRSVVQRIEVQAWRMQEQCSPTPRGSAEKPVATSDPSHKGLVYSTDQLDGDRWLRLLDTWEQQLAADQKHRRTRHELRSRIRGLRREAREYRELLDDLKVQRGALLVRGGAATTDEFEQRARWSARRTFLEDQAADARRDLEAICAKYPDLAVVESDMEAYDADRNSHAIEVCEQEAADLEHDLAQTHERLGGVKHELSQLEQDRRPADLRFEREQVLTEIRLAVGRWFAWETAAAAVEELRSRYERTCQPATLADASRFLARLTCGRYTNVWTPLGQRQLRVDENTGETPVPRDEKPCRSLLVESLSRGTREQLFLAVRLAVVQSLARRGVRLPMVLDDVIVNFDQRRAEAAVELLLDFAAQQHQVLFFTCHQHLADLFESKGVTPIWLPAHSVPLPDTSPRRLAG